MVSENCIHETLVVETSDFSSSGGFQRASAEKRASAATSLNLVGKARAEGVETGKPDIFPGPLVLPDDLLAVDSEEDDPQSLQDYIDLEERNEVTPDRRTIYVIAPPKVDKSVDFVSEWAQPVSSTGKNAGKSHPVASKNLHRDVLRYISASYHGLPVKLYKSAMKFTRHGNLKSKTPDRIDLAFSDLLLDVRTRACPDGRFPRQLNLNDLIDVLINLLPSDAYAVLMLVDHDIWEDDDDTFVCGRAYGASRVAVISAARYNPALDADEGWTGMHAWPASHCKAYIDGCILEHEQLVGGPKKKRTKNGKAGKGRSAQSMQVRDSAMRKAVDAYRRVWEATDTASAEAFQRLWLARVCRTSSHELGHCIGMDHCSYYACLMQGTCGMEEDMRQPPYLCPVDQAKLLLTTGSSERGRNLALLRLCEEPAWSAEPMFAAYVAWLKSVLGIDETDGVSEKTSIEID